MALYDKTIGRIAGLGVRFSNSFSNWGSAVHPGQPLISRRNLLLNPITIGAATGAGGTAAWTGWQNHRDRGNRSVWKRSVAGGMLGAALGAGYMAGRYRKAPPGAAKPEFDANGSFDNAHG